MSKQKDKRKQSFGEDVLFQWCLKNKQCTSSSQTNYVNNILYQHVQENYHNSGETNYQTYSNRQFPLSS